ncbi:hypothetical protein K1719_023062 [Acacia pycnantha]|nr:hypothetical protein K1719_023062 [Acacia pycnantha]
MAETAKLQIQSCRNSTTSMRQVQEMNVADSECAELRRLLEEARELVLRLKQENEDEAQMAKREIEKMSRLLAEARKDVEYATTRVDFAEVLACLVQRILHIWF